MHRLVLDLSRAGSHALDIRVARTNAAIAGSPFIFDVKAAAPDARRSQLLLRPDSTRFELALRDAFGNASQLGAAQQLSVTALPSPPFHMVSIEARPGLVGVYTGTYRMDAKMAAQAPPAVQMQASIDGETIPCIVAASASERTREEQAQARAQGAGEEEKVFDDAIAPSAAAPPSPAALPRAVAPQQRSPHQQRHVLRPIFDGYAPFSLDAMRAFARDFALIDGFLTSEQVEWAFFSVAKAGSALSFEQWLAAVELLAMAKFPGDSRATALLVEQELIPRARRLA